jgi:hypothetical protein
MAASLKPEIRQRVVPLRYGMLLNLLLEFLLCSTKTQQYVIVKMQGDDKDFFKFRVGSNEVRNILFPVRTIINDVLTSWMRWGRKYYVSLSF